MKILVNIFSDYDRTTDLAKYCFSQLGFDNIIINQSDSTFVDKYNQLTKIVINSDYDIIIRSDGDCLVFNDLSQLINKITKDIHFTQGHYYDNLMKRFRGGAPQVISRIVFEKIDSSSLKIKECSKPESNLVSQMRNNFKNFKTFTCLHEYEQYNSKLVRTLINRFKRNHKHLYDLKSLSKNGYEQVIKTANKLYQKHKNTSDCIYIKDNLSYLDIEQTAIEETDLSFLYEKYKKLYLNFKQNKRI